MPLLSRIRKASRRTTLAAAIFLSGCSSSVIVESSFPSPLVEPLPVSMGVLIPEELYDYIHTEEIPDQSLWTIALGDANVAMLEPLFKKMFRETHKVEAIPVGADSASLDGVIEPTLEKFEFDVPVGERDKFVEVWMQYELKLYEPNGDMIIAWPVSGYGKSELGRDREDAVQRAAIVAMREVGATISVKFAQQPQVSTWLGEKRHGTSASLQPATADAVTVQTQSGR